MEVTISPATPEDQSPPKFPQALPADYRSWPGFLLNVQRPDAAQIRDIYINQVGTSATQGQPFPNGTLLVMDLYDVAKDAAGAAVLAPDGLLVKGALLKTYVMGKDAGWGDAVAPELRNGDWLYGVYSADGAGPLPDATQGCFGCHLPLGSGVDWVHRYDEYFQARPPKVPLPAEYRSWPVFLHVQRPDANQVRDIYINPVGLTSTPGQPFPEGTEFVMDLFDIEKDSAGNPLTGVDGSLTKSALLKTYVMAKNQGWGEYVSPELRNGDWLYGVYAADGITELPDSTDGCFACHLPLGSSVDWVHRYNEFFMARAPKVSVPPDYRSFPIFLQNVQRPDAGQIRDIYVNQVGSTAVQGQPFPDGTEFVMDLFDVQKDAAGTALTGAVGLMVKGPLLKTYVMQKSAGYGNYIPPELRNGDWLYGAYMADGVTELPDSTGPCFACHLPLGAQVDWVHRYDEYFLSRAP